MATERDADEIYEAMEKAKEHPYSCYWVKGIRIVYSKASDEYVATFDCDLDIFFKHITFQSNMIYFMTEDGDGPHAVSSILHKGLTEMN